MAFFPGRLRTRCRPQAGILLRNQTHGLRIKARMRELEGRFDIALFLQSARASVKLGLMGPRSLGRAGRCRSGHRRSTVRRPNSPPAVLPACAWNLTVTFVFPLVSSAGRGQVTS
jgi:hypothetical protein